MRKRMAVCAASMLGLGCSANNNFGPNGNDVEGGDAGQSDTGDNMGGNDLGESTHWRLSAEIRVSGGVPIAAESALVVDLVEVDADGLESGCGAVADVATLLDAGALPDDRWLLTWWQVTPSTWGGDCNPDQLAVFDIGQFGLGVGLLHPELAAVLGTMESADPGAEHSLSGAYASFDAGESILAYGAAGLPAAFAGESEAPSSAPLDDGLWRLEPLYSFQ